MGVVYSPEEVGDRFVPKVGDHAELGRYLLSVVGHNHIRAGIVYGSTATGQPNLRSDVDVLLITDRGSEVEAVEVSRKISKKLFEAGNYAKAELHLEPTVPYLKPGQADLQYIDHFKRIERDYPDWSRGDIFKYLNTETPCLESLVRDVVGFAASKSSKFAGACYTNQLDLKTMQRAYEMPVAMSRKMQQIMTGVLADTYPTENKARMRDTGVRMLRFFMDEGFPGAEEGSFLHGKLIDLDKDYTLKLQDSLQTGDVDSYGEYLESRYLSVIETAYSYSQIWREIIDRFEP